MTERRKPQPYILARTFQEAHAFARETLGLEHGLYRVCTSAGTIKSIRNCDLILAPGWVRRHDGFNMRAAIRWTHMNVIDWEKQQAEAPAEPILDGLEPAGTQPSLDADEATAFFADVETEEFRQRMSPEGQAATLAAATEEIAATLDEQAEAPAPRRRSKCKSCGTLHFRDEDCPETPIPGA